MRTNYCGLISEQYLDQTVTVKGWVHRRRDHGGVIFIDLRDREGIVQVVIDPDTPEIILSLVVPSGRLRTRPVMLKTYSLREESAAANASGVSGSITT